MLGCCCLCWWARGGRGVAAGRIARVRPVGMKGSNFVDRCLEIFEFEIGAMGNLGQPTLCFCPVAIDANCWTPHTLHTEHCIEKVGIKACDGGFRVDTRVALALSLSLGVGMRLGRIDGRIGKDCEDTGSIGGPGRFACGLRGLGTGCGRCDVGTN